MNHGVNIRYDGNKSPRHIPKSVYVSWSCPTVRVTIVTYVHTMVHTKFFLIRISGGLIGISGALISYQPDTEHIRNFQIYT